MVTLTADLVKKKINANSLAEIKNLNLWGSELSEVSILAEMVNVEVLSLSMNRITTLEALTKCAKLQELYLRKNEVTYLTEIVHLANLKDLRVLWLCDNPCADEVDYRPRVIQYLPHLHKLDHTGITDAERNAALERTTNPLQPPYTRKELPVEVDTTATKQRRSLSDNIASYCAAANYAPANNCCGAEPCGPNHELKDSSKEKPEIAGIPRQGGKAKGSSSNILYAIMALLGEMDEDGLKIVKEDVDERLNGFFKP